MLPNKGAPEGSRRFSCCRGTQRGIGRLSSHFAGKCPAKWVKCECASEVTALSNKHVLIRRISINFSNWNPFSYFFFSSFPSLFFFPCPLYRINFSIFFIIFDFQAHLNCCSDEIWWHLMWLGKVQWSVPAGWLFVAHSTGKHRVCGLISVCKPTLSWKSSCYHSLLAACTQVRMQSYQWISSSLHPEKAAVTWRPQDIVSGNSACAISSLCCISRAAIFHCHPFWWYLEQKGLPMITFWVNS